MRDVRIRFAKTGKAKYISHLDLTRCFARAIFRAKIPLWFTEGFNPRPYMMNQIEESRYRVEVEPSSGDPEALAEAFRQVSEQDHLTVEKSGKRGKRKVMKQIDLKEYIKDLSITTEGERTVMEVTLPSSSQFGVNPRLFLDKFLSETGEEPVRIRMMREAMYIADGILFE